MNHAAQRPLHRRHPLLPHLLHSTPQAQSTILHPCLPKGSTTVHAGSALEGVGDWSHCLELQRGLFDAQSGPLPLDSAASLTFFGFSYLYDRVAAIGLLDGHSVLFGNQSVTRRSIERGGASLCALDHTALASRFAAHPEGDKAHLFCGDVAYISALLASLGFRESTELTVANKLGVRRAALPPRDP